MRNSSKPSVLSFEIHEKRQGVRYPRTHIAFTMHPKLAATATSQAGARDEVAAQLLEHVAGQLRNGRHKTRLIVSITHSYVKYPSSHQEIAAQVRALRDLADDLERRCSPAKHDENGSDDTHLIGVRN